MDSRSRHIALEGASNFRDLGGYVGHSGRAVRWRVLFRSDHLARLSAADHQHIHALRIGRSFDFRGAQESQAQAYELPRAERHSLAIEPTLLQHLHAQVQVGRTVTPGDAADAMHATYRGLVRNNSEPFARLFSHLLAHDGPLVFHCTAGKDRTGLAAALILSALGVSQEDILQDYLLTNALYRHEPGPTAVLDPDVMAVVWRVQAGYLQAAFQAIDSDFGSMAQYLELRLGLTPQALDRLRQTYLD